MRAGLLALSLAVVLAGCGGDEGNGGSDTQTTTTTVSECETVESPEPRDAPELSPPEGTLDPGKTWSLTMQTSCGDFTVELDPSLAPEATASVVHLAREGFYDDTVFHGSCRVRHPGGRPDTDRDGRAGVRDARRPSRSRALHEGHRRDGEVRARARGDGGSQFFVVTADGVNLPPEYAIIGRVWAWTSSTGSRLNDAEEKPTQPVIVRTITVSGPDDRRRRRARGGRAPRFGAPKRRLICLASSRLAESPWTSGRRRSAYELEASGGSWASDATRPCAGGHAAGRRSLRPRRARPGRRGRGRRLADGGSLPAAVARVLDDWRAGGGSSPPPTPRPRSSTRRRQGGLGGVPDGVSRRPRGSSVRRPRAPGDIVAGDWSS
jgi:cyclophilin family peptidyl-prolyl cis-trans isomerase